MIAQDLREQVFQANLKLVHYGLVTLTWGNASGLDRQRGWMAIKPSGVDYNSLTPADIVIVDVETGEVVDGALRPSADTPTHRVLYRCYDNIGGIVHTHSRYATVWAQAGLDLPCFGTTHADYFYGAIPCTDLMDGEEVFGEAGYERNTGVKIVTHFAEHDLDPIRMPGVLVQGHGPFTWGDNAAYAVETAVVLEEVAKMGWDTLQLNPRAKPLPRAMLDKHFYRKHGPASYYGQVCPIPAGELIHAR